MSHKVVRDCFRKVIDGWSYEQALLVLDGQYDGDIGYNPGSQMIQIAGIGILNDVDHYIKEELRVQHYLRYMDDFILIHHDRDFLIDCQVKIGQRLKAMDCTYNRNKTGVIRLSEGIMFLGFEFRLSKTGKVIMILNSDNVKHERKKLRKLVHKALRGETTKAKVDECYNAWKNHASKGNSYHLLQRMDKYYAELWKGETDLYSL